MKIAPPRICCRVLLYSAVICLVPVLSYAQVPDPPSEPSDNVPIEEVEEEETEVVEDSTAEAPKREAKVKLVEKGPKRLAAPVVEKKEDEKKHTLSASAGLSTSAGQGLFAGMKNETNIKDSDIRDTPGSRWYSHHSLSMGMSISLGYSYTDHSVSAGIGGTQYLIGGSEKPQDFVLGDLGLSYGWGGYTFEAIDTKLSAGASISLPTSESSRNRQIYLGTSARVGLSKTFVDSLTISLTIGAGKTFHKYAQVVDKVKRDENNIPNILHRESEIIDSDYASVGGINTEWSQTTSLGLSWGLWGLGFNLGYTFSQFWTYDVNDLDIAIPDATDVDGKQIAQLSGRGYGQRVSASFGLSYGLPVSWLKGLSLSLSFSTSQTPKTTDNKSFNFPFWNFSGAAANASGVTLSLSYRYGYSF